MHIGNIANLQFLSPFLCPSSFNTSSKPASTLTLSMLTFICWQQQLQLYHSLGFLLMKCEECHTSMECMSCRVIYEWRVLKIQFSRSVLERIATSFPPYSGMVSLLSGNIDCQAIDWVWGQKDFWIFGLLALDSMCYSLCSQLLTRLWLCAVELS